MNTRLEILNTDGQIVMCNIIAQWQMKNINYIAYTSDSDKNNISKELFVSKIHNDGNNMHLIEITDDQEWEEATNFLSQNLIDDGDFDE